VTTLGYGDIVPKTPTGYLIGSLCAITGIIFTTLPIPVIVNNFTMFYQHAKARQKLKNHSVRQKHLPNRAGAMRFHSNEVRYNSGEEDDELRSHDETEFNFEDRGIRVFFFFLFLSFSTCLDL
jgi:hypothetical protein